ncbi:hypothetical protein GCM10025771_03190 [Niveibacterium umoris]|uniref:Uncharacterized protein n=1 Tax=Niveibacterium umoris TaxID=1193620 RepID=A0A840BRR9_9RHOO|nr:hypothetical protein [Niveibacterium umoris]MBB4014139.1 hypothetical protein [Niveibacterium umoris]
MIDLSDAAIFGIRDAQGHKNETRVAEFRGAQPRNELGITTRLLNALRGADTREGGARKLK